MEKSEQRPGTGKPRGLGCGTPKPAGKINKTCVDCGARASVTVKTLICAACGGPLTSSYDD